MRRRVLLSTGRRLSKKNNCNRNIYTGKGGGVPLPDTYVATHLRQEVGSHSGTGWVALTIAVSVNTGEHDEHADDAGGGAGGVGAGPPRYWWRRLCLPPEEEGHCRELVDCVRQP
jgi:hypothetical protein